MTRKRIGIVLAFAVALVAVLMWSVSSFSSRIVAVRTHDSPSGSAASPEITPSGSQPQVASNARETENIRERRIWNSALATPIRFYGRVVDEKGTPIGDAKVQISLHDHVWSGDSKIEKLSDVDGRFSAAGRGLGIGVMVSKKGYYHLTQSDGVFGYAAGTGTQPPHSDPSDPAVFVLRKMGKVASLVSFESDFPISKTGSPVRVDLATGRKATLGSEVVEVQTWTDDSSHQANFNIPFNWRCIISVLNGGLLPRKGEFDFEAPENGYQNSDTINMPVALSGQWRSQVSRKYFLKFESGRYARLEFTMSAGGNHFFTIASYLNPTPGDRNLEFDPAKEIKVR